MAKCLKFNGFFGDPRNPPPEMSRAIVFVSSLLLRYSSSGQPKVCFAFGCRVVPEWGAKNSVCFRFQLHLTIAQASSDRGHKWFGDGGVHPQEQRHHQVRHHPRGRGHLPHHVLLQPQLLPQRHKTGFPKPPGVSCPPKLELLNILFVQGCPGDQVDSQRGRGEH